jgi:hypothetical protein
VFDRQGELSRVRCVTDIRALEIEERIRDPLKTQRAGRENPDAAPEP